jgi:hypothetical protein
MSSEIEKGALNDQVTIPSKLPRSCCFVYA